MAMNPEVKRLWVEALRSGKYQQAKGRLRGDDGYCCLGVLCDISGQGEWFEVNDTAGRAILYKGEETHLPDEVMAWADLEDPYPKVESVAMPDGTVLNDLAMLNDGGFTFEEIADLIEKHL